MYNIPRELTINLDKYQRSVLEKEKLIEVISSYKNIGFLEFYIESINIALENDPRLSTIEDIKDILSASRKQINKLKGVDEVVETFKEVKENTTKFENISLICSPKEINDKTLEGVKKDVYYLKVNINGKNELYELNSKERVMNIINNIELLKNMSEPELISQLTSKEFCTKLHNKEIEMKDGKAITPDYIKEEVNNIYDDYIKETFENNIDDVIKERIDLNEYVKRHIPEAKIEYALNSNGERIYIVKEKIIKFEGKERNMYFLSENGDDVVNTVSFEKYQSNTNEYTEKNIEEYRNNPELIRGHLYLLFENLDLTIEQKENVISFLEICITNEEKGISNYEMQEIFDEYYAYAKENNIYPDESIKVIFDRKDKLEKTNINENTNELKNKPKEKQLLLTNYNGFIATAIILESSLVLFFIMALIALFK